jgi:adenylate kinase
MISQENKSATVNTNDLYLEMAIQSVLYHYKNKLKHNSPDEQLVQEMAAEINKKANQFKNITDTTMRMLDAT